MNPKVKTSFSDSIINKVFTIQDDKDNPYNPADVGTE